MIDIDHWWKKTLEKVIKDTPFVAALIEVVEGLGTERWTWISSRK